MSVDLDQHLNQGRDAIVSAALDRTIRNIPIKEVKQVLDILVEEKALTREQALGVLVVDGRIFHPKLFNA